MRILHRPITRRPSTWTAAALSVGLCAISRKNLVLSLAVTISRISLTRYQSGSAKMRCNQGILCSLKHHTLTRVRNHKHTVRLVHIAELVSCAVHTTLYPRTHIHTRVLNVHVLVIPNRTYRHATCRNLAWRWRQDTGCTMEQRRRGDS